MFSALGSGRPPSPFRPLYLYVKLDRMVQRERDPTSNHTYDANYKAWFTCGVVWWSDRDVENHWLLRLKGLFTLQIWYG